MVESLSVTWRSECKINDAFRLVEAIVWCGPCLLSSGSGGELRFFSQAPKIRKNPVHHFLSMVLHPLVQIHIFKENHKVQNVAVCSRLVVCSAGKAVSLVHVEVRGENLRLGRLLTLLPLSSTIVALSLIRTACGGYSGQGMCPLERARISRGTCTTRCLSVLWSPCVTTYVRPNGCRHMQRFNSPVWKQDWDAQKCKWPSLSSP